MRLSEIMIDFFIHFKFLSREEIRGVLCLMGWAAALYRVYALSVIILIPQSFSIDTGSARIKDVRDMI